MKRIYISLLLALMALPMLAGNYQHSIGLVLGSKEGLTYKGFLGSNTALVVDLAWQMDRTIGSYSAYSDIYKLWYWDISVNPNLVYQKAFIEDSWGGFDWFAGAGVSLGLAQGFYSETAEVFGKFGVNAIAGLEAHFNAPVAVSLDFRPGYALGFEDSSYVLNTFDWALALSLRYCF